MGVEIADEGVRLRERLGCLPGGDHAEGCKQGLFLWET